MVDTVRTESELQAIFQDGQADNSITEQDMRDFIVSIKYLNGQGWDFHLDGTYTVGSPRSIAGGIRTQVTIDGTAGDFGHPILTHTSDHYWNTTTNKVEPPNENDFGFLRFAVAAKSTSDPNNYFDVELDINGGSYPVIFAETAVFAKGAGVSQHFNFMIPLFAGPEFVTNGGKLYITPNSAATFWEFGLTATRTYLAMP